MDDFKKRLLDAELTEDDVRAILDWQLSLPAEQMDCDLMRECDLFLSPDAPGMWRWAAIRGSTSAIWTRCFLNKLDWKRSPPLRRTSLLFVRRGTPGEPSGNPEGTADGYNGLQLQCNNIDLEE